MVKQSLLSSTLVLGQAAEYFTEDAGSNRPVFGLPFCFGKPLTFGTPDCTERETHCADAQQTRQFDTSINVASRNTCSLRSRQLSSSSCIAQQCTKQQKDSRNRSMGTNHASIGTDGNAASQYYLGSLGAALAQGFAAPAATAAAAQATCVAAAQLAAASMVCAAQASQNQSTKSSSTLIQFPTKQAAAAQQKNSASATGTTESASTVAMAASVAAAAACSGCPGCRMMLERLQRCTKCCSKDIQSMRARSGNCGVLTQIEGMSGAHAAGSSTANKAKRKSCEADNEHARHQKDETPGPGFYSVPGSFGSHGVAFSMGAKPAATMTASKTLLSATENPGPGAYYNPRASSAGGPAFSFGGRWKEPGQDVGAPGPGEHQQTMFVSDGPAFSIYARTEKAARTSGSTSPGPGAYAPDWDRSCSPSGPAFTLGGRIPDSSRTGRSSSPGPAAYQKAEFKPDGPAFSIPAKHKPRRSAAGGTPAPTDYDTSSMNAIGKAAPAFSIAAKRCSDIDQMFKELFPGPGAYQVAAVGPGGPAFSMGSKPCGQKAQAEAAQKPAPGDYHRELPQSGHAFSIAGRSVSPAAEHDDSAGPGMYYNPAAEAALQSSKAFTIGARFAAGERAPGADSPGPASYAPLEEGTGPSYTIGGRLANIDKASDSPGPASYTVKPTLPEGPAFSMGARPSEKHMAAEDAGPAVGEYNVIDTAGGPAWTMGSKAAAGRDTCITDIPGPGYYMPEPPGPSGPAWSIAGRLPDKQPNQEDSDAGPGPGEYHNEIGGGASGPAFTMSGKVGPAADNTDIPGPGAYFPVGYVEPSAAGAPAFTIGSRIGQGNLQVAGPGPGAFDLPVLPRGPCYTIARRMAADDAPRASSPGPATYSVVEAAAAVAGSTPAWTMGIKLQDKGSDGSPIPAPGDYDATNPAAVAAPAWTISAKPAEKGISEEQLMPGPGYYTPVDVVKQGQGAAFTIARRWVDKSAEAGDALPAPGAYNIPVGPGGAAFTIAGRLVQSNAAAAAAATPAPGQYHKPSQLGNDAPAFTIAARLANADAGADDQPGPGAYEYADPSATAMAAAPAFTMSGRPALSAAAAAADGPGVGQYDAHLVDLGPSAPAFSMAGKLPVDSKAPDGPACVDYDTEKGVTSINPAAPAFTMGAKLADTLAAQDSDVPAPGYYHCPATEGAPPHAPAAPAYSIQGKHKKGKSKLRQILGKLADIDHATPGPGEHQPAAGGTTAHSGPAFSFGPAAAAATAMENAQQGDPQQQQHTLAQLQAQLARLLTHETQQRKAKAGNVAAAAAATAQSKQQLGGDLADRGSTVSSAARRSGSRKEVCAQTIQQQQQATGQVLLSEKCASSLAAMREAVADALQTGSARRRLKGNSSDGGCCKGGLSKVTVDYTTPAPGDHSVASSTLGPSGPAYTMAGKMKNSTDGSLRAAAARLANAEGAAAVLAAAAAVDRLSGTPGVGTYKVERAFPYPEGKLVYKPILKGHKGGGSAAGTMGVSSNSVLAQLHGSSGQLSRTRRVSWADQP